MVSYTLSEILPPPTTFYLLFFMYLENCIKILFLRFSIISTYTKCRKMKQKKNYIAPIYH